MHFTERKQFGERTKGLGLQTAYTNEKATNIYVKSYCEDSGIGLECGQYVPLDNFKCKCYQTILWASNYTFIVANGGHIGDFSGVTKKKGETLSVWGLFIWRRVIPVSGLARLPTRIISCVYMVLFIPSTGKKNLIDMFT